MPEVVTLLRFTGCRHGGGLGDWQESWGARVEEAEREAHQESRDEELQQDVVALPLEKQPPWLQI